jgi:hypothetical protein
MSTTEETLTEFLSKATGTAVEWVQMPGMKVNLIWISPCFIWTRKFLHGLFSIQFSFHGHLQPGPDSIGIIAISHGSTGVAVRACELVGMEPAKVNFFVSLLHATFRSGKVHMPQPDLYQFRLLKSSRITAVAARLLVDGSGECVATPADNNGTIELLYMQVWLASSKWWTETFN